MNVIARLLVRRPPRVSNISFGDRPHDALHHAMVGGWRDGHFLHVPAESLDVLRNAAHLSFDTADRIGAVLAATAPTPGSAPGMGAAPAVPARIGCVRCHSAAAFSVQFRLVHHRAEVLGTRRQFLHAPPARERKIHTMGTMHEQILLYGASEAAELKRILLPLDATYQASRFRTPMIGVLTIPGI
jgi:hypothetical protein